MGDQLSHSEGLAANIHASPTSRHSSIMLGNSKSQWGGGPLGCDSLNPPPSAGDSPRWGSEIFLTAANCSHIREETQHRVADLMGLEGRENQTDQHP